MNYVVYMEVYANYVTGNKLLGRIRASGDCVDYEVAKVVRSQLNNHQHPAHGTLMNIVHSLYKLHDVGAGRAMFIIAAE